MKRNLKIGIISTLIIIGGAFGMYKYNKVQAYNALITNANKYMDTGDYDKAESLLEQSKYKDDPNVQKNIELAKKLKEVKVIYNDATKLMNDKKYLDAIEKFKKISKDAGSLFSNAQKNIEDCKKQYIAQNLQDANESLKNNKFDDANECLNNVFKIDSSNAEGVKLKAVVANANKKQKEEQELKQKDIRSLGELRKSLYNNYIILTEEERSKVRAEPDKFDYSKYENYVVVGIGNGKSYDPDTKLVEPDLIINGELAYSVWCKDAVVELGGGNLKDFSVLGVNGKKYTLNEVQDAVNNNKAFYKDGKPFELPTFITAGKGLENQKK